MKTIFYGSLYNNEFSTYKETIEEQFKHCAEKIKADGMELETWGFDVLVEDPDNKLIAQKFVQECAEKYFPGVQSVSEKS